MCFDFCLRVIWLLVLLNIIHLTNFSLNFLTQSHFLWIWHQRSDLAVVSPITVDFGWILTMLAQVFCSWALLMVLVPIHMVGPPGFDIMFHILRVWNLCRDLPQGPSQPAHDCYLCSKRVNFTGSLHDSWQYEFECQRDGDYFNVQGQKHAFMKILEN